MKILTLNWKQGKRNDLDNVSQNIFKVLSTVEFDSYIKNVNEHIFDIQVNCEQSRYG